MMSHAMVEDVLVVTHGPHAPDDAQWDAYLTTYRERQKEMRALIVYSLGGGPTGRQRAQLTELLDTLDEVAPALIFTDSIVMRGIVAVVGWFLPPERRARIYAPDQLPDVLVQIGLSPRVRAAIEAKIQAQLAQIDGQQSKHE